MNKADKILAEVNLTHGKYQELNDSLQKGFETSNYKGSNYKGRPFIVSIRGDNVSFPDACPMKRDEAVRMAHWILEMLEE